MGLFGKIKDIFYDDVEPEETTLKEEIKEVKVEPVRVEVKPEVKPEVKAPEVVRTEVKPEVKTENTFSERELFRSERTFNYIDFDDEDEEAVKKPVIEEKPVSRINNINLVPEKPKVFKPSPVISPIYGILDKDYKKDDAGIVVKESTPSYRDTKSYDSIRRKAYGSLEEDLEKTLTKPVKVVAEVSNAVDEIETEVNKLEDKTAKIEDLISKIENSSSVTVGELEDHEKDKMFEDTEELEPVDDDKTMTDNTLEHDLFNLIDSMYEDKEE